MEQKKYFNVTIEQPLVKTWTIEAKDAEDAQRIAQEKYSSEEWVLTGDDYGTDAQCSIMEVDEEGDEKIDGEQVDWTDLY